MKVIIKKTILVGCVIFISRISSLIRDSIIALKLGSLPTNYAFITAFRLINIFKNIISDSTLSNIFIPEFAKTLQIYGKKEAMKFASQIHTILISILFVICKLLIIFMPLIIKLFVNNYNNSWTPNFIITFGRIISPYLLFVSIASFYGSILNTFYKFLPLTIAPIILNISMIISITISDNNVNYGHNLCYGVLIGGILELAWMKISLNKYRYNIFITKIIFTRKIYQISRKIIPIMMSYSIIHINLLLNTMFLSYFTSAISYFYYAERIIQFPNAIIGNAINVVLLPIISKKIVKRKKSFIIQKNIIDFINQITIPVSLGLLYLSKEIIITLLERGMFNKYDTIHTTKILQILSLIVPTLSIIKMLKIQFFVYMKSNIPLISSIISIISNTTLNLILIKRLGFIGVSIANLISSWMNLIFLTIVYKQIFNTCLSNRLLKKITIYIILSCCTIMMVDLYSLTLKLNISMINLFKKITVGSILYYILLVYSKRYIL